MENQENRKNQENKKTEKRKTKIQKYNDVKTWLEARVHNTIHINTPDFDIMMDMLKKHPNFSKWKNQSCLAFKITRAKKTKHLQVYIKQLSLKNITKKSKKIKTNQTKTNQTKTNPIERWRIISWVACVKGNVETKSSEKNKLTQAMRYAIRKQIQIWRNTIGKNHELGRKCVLCECDNYEKLEVDHFPKTFSQIKKEFCDNNEIDEKMVEKTKDEKTKDEKTKDKKTKKKIKIIWSPSKTTYQFQKGEKTNMKWQQYHRIHASYRWLCGTCNKKTNSKGTNSKGTKETNSIGTNSK